MKKYLDKILQNNNRILLFSLFFLWGLFVAIIVCKLFNSLSWFSVEFSTILEIVVTSVIAIFITYYLGGLLSRSDKILDLRLEGIKKIEEQIEKLFEYFQQIVSLQSENKIDDNINEKLVNLFTNIFEIQDIYIEDALNDDFLYLTPLKEIYSSSNNLWELITGDGFDSTSNKYSSEVLSSIYDLKHSISVNIHRCKMLIFS